MNLFSIRHTGTHLVQDILTRAGVPFRPLHIDEAYAEALCAQITGDTIVVPLRHPARVLRSWLGRTGINNTETKLWAAWDFLISKIAPTQPHYLTVDVPEIRDAQLSKLSAAIDYPLETEWPVLNSHTDSNQCPLDISQVPPRILNFYEEQYRD